MHTLPSLPYDHTALEPYIDGETMRVHHTKHHQAYVDKLNTALESAPSLADQPIEDLIKDLNNLPEDIRGAVKNHGGGHYNHSLFWGMLVPYAGVEHVPGGELAEAIDKSFGDFIKFSESFKSSALAVFGSGWTWLVVDADKKLKIVNTPNQENPLTNGEVPILGVDIWEHAYYLKYQNRRAEYLDNFFQIINWDYVAELYKKAL